MLHSNQYLLYKNPKGYVNNSNITNLPSNVIVAGSLNVEIVTSFLNGGLNSELRNTPGHKNILKSVCCNPYNPDTKAVLSGKFSWNRKFKQPMLVRHYGSEMYASEDMENWVLINKSNFSGDLEWNYTTHWVDNAKSDILLFLNGLQGDKVYAWDGGLSKVLSVVQTGTLFDIRVSDVSNLENDNKTIIANCGTEYTYTEIVGNTIKGVNLGSIDAGCYVASPVYSKTFDLSLDDGTLTIKNFSPHSLLNYKGHIVYIDKYQKIVLVSTTYDYSLLYGGTAGSSFGAEYGFYHRMPEFPVAVINLNDGVLISGENNTLHFIRKTFSTTDLYSATWSFEDLTNGDQQGIKHQWLSRIVRSELSYVSNEPNVNMVDFGGMTVGNNITGYSALSADGGSENYQRIGRSKITNIGNEIQNDLDMLDRNDFFNKARLFFHKGHLYLTCPFASRTYKYEDNFGYWQAPKNRSYGALEEFKGKLYGYDYSSLDVYEIDEKYHSYGDDEIPYVIATISNDYGTPTMLKHNSKVFLDGYMTENITWSINLNRSGSNLTKQSCYFTTWNKEDKEMKRQEAHVNSPADYSYFGDTGMQDYIYSVAPYFRLSYINAFTPIDHTGTAFLREQIVLYTNSKNAQFQISSFGTNSNDAEVSTQHLETFTK